MIDVVPILFTFLLGFIGGFIVSKLVYMPTPISHRNAAKKAVDKLLKEKNIKKQNK